MWYHVLDHPYLIPRHLFLFDFFCLLVMVDAIEVQG